MNANAEDDSNPLLAPLGGYRLLADWPPTLRFDPLHGVNRAALHPERRQRYLDEDMRLLFEPTVLSSRVAFDINRMIRASYRARNPVDRAARQALNQVLSAEDSSLEKIDWSAPHVFAKISMGITGLGKSHDVRRALALLPQVHRHGPNEKVGWAAQSQIVHLTVPMSHDGSRGGLLMNIAAEVDELLGTNYVQEYAKLTVDKQAVKICKLLAAFYTGVLVIEELQERNFSSTKYAQELLLLLLKILNLGIPVLFVGNPQAFTSTGRHTQDLRRMMSYEPASYWPYEETDLDWSDGLVPALWGYSVTPKRGELTPSIRATLYRESAGLPDLLRLLCKGSQETALNQGSEQCDLSHLTRFVRHSETVSKWRDLVVGLRDRDVDRLGRLADIPVTDFCRRWSISPATTVEIQPEFSPPSKVNGAALARSIASGNTKKPRQTKSLTKAYPPGDLRSGDLAGELLRDIKELQTTVAAGSENKR